jgi:hypothetical protein
MGIYPPAKLDYLRPRNRGVPLSGKSVASIFSLITACRAKEGPLHVTVRYPVRLRISTQSLKGILQRPIVVIRRVSLF